MLRAYNLAGGRTGPPGSDAGNVRTAHNPVALISAVWSRLSGFFFGAMLIALLGATGPAAAYESFQNGRLRFGTGAEASVNALGNLQQPFYYDAALGGGGWYKLTYSNYPLDNAIGVGGDGTSNWNTNGTIAQNPSLSGQVLDMSTFVRTSGDNGYGTIVSTGNVTVGGQTFQVRQAYSLGQTDSFVRIVTRVTNTSASPLQNVRVWVGTRDDWVGTTDQPTKRRGNLIGGAFVDIPTASTQSAALQISSGSTGVLFFSTSPRAYTSINWCCSFSSAYTQNPATSAITLTNDGSYALFVRMNDLAVGQSDEFTWYYAAGSVSNLGQIIAAVSAATAISLPVNAPVAPFTPVTSSGGTPPFSYSISPALPAGLIFNTATGQITGTPLATSPSTVYTVTITDAVPTSTSATFTMSITNPTGTQINLTSSAHVIGYGLPVTLSATVEGASPTGTLNFTVLHAGPGGTVVVPVCSNVPLVSGAGSCLVSGEHQKVDPVFYQVAYSGDDNNRGAMASLMQTVTLTSVTLTVSASPQTPLAGQSMILNALVVQQGLNGAVTFYENGAALPGCSAVALSSVAGSADNGAATCRINALSAGSHSFVVTFPHPVGTGFEQAYLTVTATGNAAGSVARNYSDLWWGGAKENGWGVSIDQHGMTQFVALFVYDGAGGPIWYVMPGGSWNGTSTAYTGALYQPTSTAYYKYDPSKFNPNASIGSLTITYTGDSTATLSYTINGISGTKEIVRQPFAGPDGQQGMVVNDLWWGGSAETGWGLTIDQHGQTLFPVWFTYDASYIATDPNSLGNTAFYTMPGGAWNGNTYSGDLYRSSSSPWLGGKYDATAFKPAKVGTMSLTFIDQDTATMTTVVNGVTHTDTIMRQAF